MLDDLLIRIKQVDLRLKKYSFPTIDQVIALSSAFKCVDAGLPTRKVHFIELYFLCNVFVTISRDPNRVHLEELQVNFVVDS